MTGKPNNGKPDYSRVFSRLSHMIALSDDGKLKPTVDDAVLNSLATECSGIRVTATPDVVERIRGCYGITLSELLVQSSVDRLIGKGSLLRDRTSRSLSVSPGVRADIQGRIEGTGKLENEVRVQWLSSLGYDDARVESVELWGCLQAYMASAFERHGVETVTLLVPDLLTSRRDAKHLSAYLEDAIEAKCQVTPHDTAFSAVQRFFRESTACH